MIIIGYIVVYSQYSGIFALMNKNRFYVRGMYQLVYLKCGGFDKYGRLLGELFVNQEDEISVNQQMIDNNYGYVYHGGTKKV